jgi:protoporphyrinogen/coproporphyrinogen III oxidase
VASARPEVAVIGGGIAGLCAARALHQQGLSFVLLEAAPRWGGVIRTERADGFLLEAGPDTILATKPDGLRLCLELGLGGRVVPTDPSRSTVFVLRRGRLHPLPPGMALGVPTEIGPLLRSGLFSWRGKIRMALEPFVPARREAADESIGSFVGRRLGREAVEIVGQPLLAGIHAGDAGRLSLAATFPRLAEIESRTGSLVRGLRAARRSARPGAPSGFVSLMGGLAELVEALVAALPGEALRKGSAARAVRRDGGGFTVEADGGAVATRAVVVALPPRTAAPLVAALAPAAGRMLAAVRFASTATVLLGYRREAVDHPLEGHGLLVPRSEGLRTTAVSFSSTKLPGRAPEGHVLLRAFLGGIDDPGVLSLDDAGLAAMAEREMRPLLRIVGAPVLRRVYRWPEATPQMEVGHLERVAAIDEHLAGVPGLFLTGAGLRVTGIPDVVADATRTAAAVVSAVRNLG